MVLWNYAMNSWGDFLSDATARLFLFCPG